MRLLTRRVALAQVGAIAAVAGLPSMARGKNRHGSDRHLIVILLRGALDGLAAVPAYGDREYRRVRGGLALAGPDQRHGVVDLDGFFGLHPALAPLHEFYSKGELLVLPTVATPCRERSHSAGRDWLNSILAPLIDTEGTSENPCMPLPAHSVSFDGATLDLITDLCHGDPSLADTIAQSSLGCDLQTALLAQADTFRQAARGIGERMAAGRGPSIAVLESHGWDTHADQGTHDGRLAIALAGLADGLAAMATACGEAWSETVVLVATEFGRSVAMNPMGGTDHGSASVAFLVGGNVAGGRVVGPWPGLAADRLYRGRDLMPVTNLSAVIGSVMIDPLNVDSPPLCPIPNLLRS